MSESQQQAQSSTDGGRTGPDGIHPGLLHHDLNNLRAVCGKSFEAAFRNHQRLDKRQSASDERQSALEGRLDELVSRITADAASSQHRADSSGQSSTLPVRNQSGTAFHRRKGGGGTKKLHAANDAFRVLLQRAMDLADKDLYPFYPIPSGTNPSPEHPFVNTPDSSLAGPEAANFKPLRPDWDILKPSGILTMRFVDPFADKILDDRSCWKIPADKGRADVVRACITSLSKIRYETRERERKGDDQYKAGKKENQVNSRRRERRKDKARARYKEYLRMTGQSIERGWNDDDDDDDEGQHPDRGAKHHLFVIDAMSEDEMDDESTAGQAWGKVGKILIPSWRSQEANDILSEVDASLVRPHASWKLVRPDFRVHTLGVEPLPPTIQRWMVSRTFAEQHPALVSEVQRNEVPFADFAEDTWGHEPDMPIRPRD